MFSLKRLACSGGKTVFSRSLGLNKVKRGIFMSQMSYSFSQQQVHHPIIQRIINGEDITNTNDILI